MVRKAPVVVGQTTSVCAGGLLVLREGTDESVRTWDDGVDGGTGGIAGPLDVVCGVPGVPVGLRC